MSIWPERSKNYSKQEDQIILNTIANRPEGMSKRKAVEQGLHLLPGRTLEGVLYRYNQHLNKKQLQAVRASALEQKRQREAEGRTGGRAGLSLEPWRPEEDAILWNAVQTRPEGQTVHAALLGAVEKDFLPGRTTSAVTNRYYVLVEKLKENGTYYLPPVPGEPVAPPPPTTPKPPEPTRPVVPPTQPAPPIKKEPPTAAEQTSSLAGRAEEFIRSLYSVVEENTTLRSQAERLKDLDRIEAELKNQCEINTRLKATIKQLEEDRDAFLRLMDKARVIGREEIGL